MKRQLYFLLMALLIPFFGCGNATSTSASNNSTQPDVQYNMAIMDKGHLILYDLTNRIAAPIEAETDSVFNMVFGSDRVYYSVKQGNKTFLKYVVLNDPDLKPQLAADWEVPYDCCVGTAYYCLEAPALQYVPEQNILAMNYMMEPNYGYSEYRIFDPATGKSVNAMDWEGDLTFLNYDMFDPFEGQFACAEDNGDLYYRQGDDMIFLSDRLEFEVDSDTPDELPFFEVLSMDPTGKYVLFKAATTLVSRPMVARWFARLWLGRYPPACPQWERHSTVSWPLLCASPIKALFLMEHNKSQYEKTLLHSHHHNGSRDHGL